MILLTDNGEVEVPEEPPSWPRPVPPDAMRFEWTGTDGTTWDLCNGVVGLLSGARGFGMPTPQHRITESQLDGASWQGLRYPPRDLFLPVEIRSSAILTAERDFFRGLNPRLEGRLRVTTPDARWREISCRYIEGSEGEYEFDPLLFNHTTYPIRMVALDPFWAGAPTALRYGYQESAGEPFYPGPPFPIGSARGLDATSLTNPGDEAAPAVVRVDGPFPSFDVRVGDMHVAATLAKSAGQWVEVDMHPHRLTVVDEAGTDQWDAVTEFDEAPIQPGENALAINLGSPLAGSAVTITLPTRYWRAW